MIKPKSTTVTIDMIEQFKTHVGQRDWRATEMAEFFGLNGYRATSSRLIQLRAAGVIMRSGDTAWRFTGAPVTQTAIPMPVSNAPASTPPMVKIGPLYLHERLVLLADTGEQGRLIIHTTIIEIDPATKHPRNKRITFKQESEPAEYRAALAWLDSMTGSAPASDDTALELAAETERKLNAANDRIKELEQQLSIVRSALGVK